MSLIFISHSGKDNAVAAEVREYLQEQGHRSIFLDFDPADGIPAGRNWEQELYRNIRSYRAVLVLCSQHSMASRWCFMEITHARALGKPLFPVKIDDCTLDGILTGHQVLDLTGNKEDAYQRLSRGILAAGLDPADVFDWDGSRPPYPGLLAFQEQDAAVFFGREDEIGEGLELLNRICRLGETGLMMVLGASGSGKSSLVRAGLLPRLRRDAARWLVVDPFRPRDNPAQELAGVLSWAYKRVGHTIPWQHILDQSQAAMERMSPIEEESPTAPELEKDSARQEIEAVVQTLEASLSTLGIPQAVRYLRLLRRAIKESEPDGVALGVGVGPPGTTFDGSLLAELASDLRLRSGCSDARVILVIDQFEELLGHPEDHPASRFLALLRASIERPHSPLLIIGTMRSDFLGQFQKNPILLDIRYETLSLGPMSSDDIAQIIEKPAEVASIDLVPGLVQALIEDAATEDALPLLAFTLRELYERYGNDKLLEVERYRNTLGGLRGAVAKAADDVLRSQPVGPAGEAQLRAAFLAMVRVTEDGNYTRRPARWDDLPAQIHPLLEKFVQARLLVSGGDGEARTLELAHEALLRSWDPLRYWLERERRSSSPAPRH